MSLEACARLVERGDPERFLALMAMPVPLRARLWPLFAFNLEVARAPWVTREPIIAEMRLQWWHDALEEIAAGGPVRRHEVTTPLSEVLPAEAVPILQDLIAARRRDVETRPFADQAELVAYLEATGGGLMRAAGLVAGGADLAALGDAGLAAGMAGYLAAVPELAARGRAPLPDAGEEAVADLAEAGLARLAAARRAWREVPRAVRPVGLMAAEAGPMLARAARAPERVAAGRLASSPAGRRLRLMWKAARGAL